MPIPGRTGAYESLQKMRFLFPIALDVPVWKEGKQMNVVDAFCGWLEETFPLTRRGLMAFGIVGAVGFVIGALCAVCCLISIIINLPVK